MAITLPITSHLYQEIHQQPTVLRNILTKEIGVVRAFAAAIEARDISHILIAGRGTSDNAGRYAQYLLGALNHLTVALATPSLFSIYHQPPRLRDTLVIGISQSGASPDIVAVVAEASKQGALTAAITNTPDSELGRTAEWVIDLHAGEEHSLAATKTYTAELAAIALLSIALAKDGQLMDSLAEIPDQVARVLAGQNAVAALAERYRYMQDCVVIGRGYNYATAFELALKLKELTYTIAEPYSSADFMHGPLALIEHGFPAIVIAPSGVMLAEMADHIRALQDREAEVIAISDDPAILAQARTALPLPSGVVECLSPLTAIVPGQLFAMCLASTRGYDPDHPRGLRKVTKTL